MFHSVRPESHINSHLSVPLNIFTKNMMALANNGYTTISLSALYDHISGKISAPDKSVVLTFDDGYLDNWVYVFPVLRKFGLKATIFPSLDFIGDGYRRSFCEQPDLHSPDYLEYKGSLRWSELIEMENSGTFDVQSHTVTHTRLFKSPEIIGFYRKGDPYAWIGWNIHPDRKAELLESDCSNLIPEGYPIFKDGRALGVKEFIPDKTLIDMLLKYSALSKTDLSSSSSGWEQNLQSIVDRWMNKYGHLGRCETDDENSHRVRKEIVLSKKTLESRLSKEVRFLCWPGGASTPEALSLAKAAGYIATTIPSFCRSRNRNIPGEDPFQIRRIGTCCRWSVGNKSTGWVSPKAFLSILDEYRTVPFASLRKKTLKLNAILKSYLITGRRIH